MFTSLSNGWKIALQLIVILAICGAAVAILTYMGAMKPVEDSRRVRFEVDASGGYASITLQAGSVSIDKPTTVTMPWSRTMQIKSGSEVYLTATNPTQTGKLVCRILLDNLDWKEETTLAPKNGVACAGIVP